MRPQWLRRYLGGERALVWHELRQHGARVREPALVDEAQAVCDEMARRARGNIEVLIERLLAQGYRFHDNDDEQTAVVPLTGPDAHAEDYVRWLEQRFGPVAMTLSSWIRIVGDVWLVGTHPEWETSAAADPLVVEVAATRYANHDRRSFLEYEHQQWREEAEDELFQLPVAPDQLTKDNVSGGGPYGIVVPDACADALIVTTAAMPFVSYLRAAFEMGGFPGWTGDGRQYPVTRSLATGLEPI